MYAGVYADGFVTVGLGVCMLVGVSVTFVPDALTGPGVTTVEIGRPGTVWLVTVQPFFSGELAVMYS